MDAQSVLYIALAVAALLLAIVLSIGLLAIRRNMEQLTRRLDETLRQVEMTAEDLRKTNASAREILSGVEQGVSNVAPVVEALRRGMRELGYVEGRNVRIEHRSALGKIELLPQLAEELVASGVDVIVTGASPQQAPRGMQAAQYRS